MICFFVETRFQECMRKVLFSLSELIRLPNTSPIFCWILIFEIFWRFKHCWINNFQIQFAKKFIPWNLRTCICRLCSLVAQIFVFRVRCTTTCYKFMTSSNIMILRSLHIRWAASDSRHAGTPTSVYIWSHDLYTHIRTCVNHLFQK